MKTIQQSIEELLGLTEEIQQRKEYLQKKLSTYDKMLSDIHHDLERVKLNACQGYIIAKRMQDIIKARRDVKHELDQIQTKNINKINTINQMIRNVHKTTEELEKKKKYVMRGNGIINKILKGELVL